MQSVTTGDELVSQNLDTKSIRSNGHCSDNQDVPTTHDTNRPLLACSLCNVTVTSERILQRHIEGRKHKMRAQRIGKTFICEICNIHANSEIQLKIHLEGNKHRSKLQENVCWIDVPRCRETWIIVLWVVFVFINLLIFCCNFV
ncbi:unnamed protein product [Callosobruchus maculatus]|uniref:C2H2-type domain-containing protein n=1 Tax=Callosobruchus maculatus TaxID=64391 RepID=A0A653BHB1_CALMS|nr:unnamed protein product [Callosobruchus maculatus]